ncbi:MAG: hypothetical protein U0165_10170 [Polyangiaceae bacterium]
MEQRSFEEQLTMQPRPPVNTESPTTVRVIALPVSPPEGSVDKRAQVVVAKYLGVPLADAAVLLRALPVVLPKAFEESVATSLSNELEGMGVTLEVQHALTGPHCDTHTAFFSREECARCKSAICSLCAARATPPLCSTCLRKSQRSRSFYLARVALWLLVLAGVVLYAWRDVRRRQARNEWTRTLDVSLVLVRYPGVSDELVDRFKARIPKLTERLEQELRRYRSDVPAPFTIKAVGPVALTSTPPMIGASDGALSALLEATKYAYSKREFLKPIDARLGLTDGDSDLRVYVLMHPSARDLNRIEGLSEQGGRIGIVELDIDGGMIDFALFVTAHEMLHTVGATERYLPNGAIMIPEGLGDPSANLMPYPQRFAEVMAFSRAVTHANDRA